MGKNAVLSEREQMRGSQRMIRRITMIIIVLTMAIVFCACDSQEVKDAKAAYEEGDYAKTVELLSKEENLNQETQDILIISEANVLYKDKKYLEAVKKLVTSSQGTQAEQYEKMFGAALDDAIATRSPDNIIELLKIDETKTDDVYKDITKACKEKNYSGFVVMEGLIEKLDDGDLKTKLSSFGKEYANLKPEAFIVGTWERQRIDDKTKGKVKVIPYNNNFIGRLEAVGSSSEKYQFHKGDVYWKDFQFENEDKFLCYNLTKDTDGNVYGETVSGDIDYKKETITIQFTQSVVKENTWKRLD